ncbi:hypothetical protein FACS1894120_6480 [Clostridia bacterium]|nr:hypothetical protein FACS1894120_6480 [Clostridia bacterium]
MIAIVSWWVNISEKGYRIGDCTINEFDTNGKLIYVLNASFDKKGEIYGEFKQIVYVSVSNLPESGNYNFCILSPMKPDLYKGTVNTYKGKLDIKGKSKETDLINYDDCSASGLAMSYQGIGINTYYNSGDYQTICKTYYDGEKLHSIYHGKMEKGLYSDKTGTADYISFDEEGNIKTLYKGNFVDGNFNDSTGNAFWFIHTPNNSYGNWGYAKGIFKNNGYASNDGGSRYYDSFEKVISAHEDDFYKISKEVRDVIYNSAT